MSDDDLRAAVVALREREAVLLAAYQATPKDRRARVTVLEAYCRNARSCLLLTVWRTPLGLAFYKPPYKLSKDLNERESSQAGRARNTRDGINHWNPSAGLLEDARSWPGHLLPLTCDHTRVNVLTAELLADADAATAGRPTRRRY